MLKAITGLIPPVAIGVAVLRHRLWDIDIVIHRTLVHSILTVILLIVYLGSVVLLQGLSLFIFEHQSPIAIVMSTLTAAALFTPLGRRIQERIDRRFFRRKYDAEQVQAKFAASLRDAAGLDSLTNSVLSVIEATIQLAQASLWLRKDRPQPS